MCHDFEQYRRNSNFKIHIKYYCESCATLEKHFIKFRKFKKTHFKIIAFIYPLKILNIIRNIMIFKFMVKHLLIWMVKKYSFSKIFQFWNNGTTSMMVYIYAKWCSTFIRKTETTHKIKTENMHAVELDNVCDF